MMLRRTVILSALGLLVGLVLGVWAARADVCLPLVFDPPASAPLILLA